MMTGVSSLVPPEVHNDLLCFANVEGEGVYLAQLRQSAYLLSVGSSLIRPTTVMTSANLELELCQSMQSWIYRRGLRTPLCGPHVEDQWQGANVAYLHHLGAARQDVQDPVAYGGVQTQGSEIFNELIGTMVLKAER
jgi:hypothetical protein